MKRLFVAVCTLVLVAGCLSAPPTNTTTTLETTGPHTTDVSPPEPERSPAYEAHVFDHTSSSETPILDGGVEYDVSGEYTADRQVTLITTSAEATRLNPEVMPDDAAAFVRNTSFDESYLVVLQEFPASSVPDYRVENVTRRGPTVYVRVNDSSQISTSDITLETVLIRVQQGDSPPDTVEMTNVATDSQSDSDTTETPDATPKPAPTPFASPNESENVDEARSIHLANVAENTNGYRVWVTYSNPPNVTAIDVLEKRGKLPADSERTFSEVVVRKGMYTATVEADVPAANGSRKTIRRNINWRVNESSFDLHITISNTNITATKTREK